MRSEEKISRGTAINTGVEKKKERRSGWDEKDRRREKIKCDRERERQRDRESIGTELLGPSGLWTDARTLFLVFGGMTVPLQCI